MPDKESESLRKSGTLNPRPDAVSDPRFADGRFFDPNDLMQVRYEMIRSHKEGATLKEVADRFGVSVATCVRIKRAFRQGGLQALVPERRGPRGPH
ncbi:MAG: helix-turn-helix domain-containing protein [Bacteroidota bacterium]|nr:helix-turn-helix domain-containing protein [Bacteroidota bacterium]